MEPLYALSLLVFLPLLGALVVAFIKSEDTVRLVTLATSLVTFLLSVWWLLLGGDLQFNVTQSEMQNVFNVSWIPSFGISYFMGLDGISLPLVVLTTFVSVLAMGASWSIKKHIKGYCILFLLLETGMIGVFMALDFFLFYVFWEVMLLPMYFLIGVWGGPRREYAAIKFFLYTLLGSVLMLIAILMLYFNSDLTVLADTLGKDSVEWQQLHLNSEIAAKVNVETGEPIHTFNILALQAMGQHTDLFSSELQVWCFILLFIGFAIKVPSVPVHTWLPDAHVEAPTPISMILAGVLLKMGGYGIIRMCYPICPFGGYELANYVCAIGLISMVYGGFAAMAQKDFKRLVAYSSVSHMGYVVLGLGVWSANSDNMYNSDYWNMGMQGAMFQMIAHGISSAGMFFMVGVIYDRVHHRNLDQFGGLFGKMPVYTALSMGIFFAGLGLPGLCGFIGEVLVVLSVWKYSIVMAVVSAAVVIITAAYILWAIQRVYLGAEYKGPHEEEIVPATFRENLIGGTLFVFAIIFGVFPYSLPFASKDSYVPSVLGYMNATVTAQAKDLADWTRRHDSKLSDEQVAESDGTE